MDLRRERERERKGVVISRGEESEGIACVEMY